MRRFLLYIWFLLPAAACSALLAGRAQESPPTAKPRDLAKLPPAQRLYALSARGGMDWLRRTNQQDGKFVYGFLPELRVPLEGDSFTAQAGAAFALIRDGHRHHLGPAWRSAGCAPAVSAPVPRWRARPSGRRRGGTP